MFFNNCINRPIHGSFNSLERFFWAKLVPKLYSSLRQIKRGSPYWPQEQKGGTWEVVSEFEGIESMVPKINEQNNLSKIVCSCEAYIIQSRRGTCNIKWTQKCEVLLRDNTRPSCPGPNKSTTSDLFWPLESGELSRLVPPTSDLQTCWLY